MKNPFKKPQAPAFPRYYRYEAGDITARVDSPETFTKMQVIDGRLMIQETRLHVARMHEIFKAPDWVRVDRAAWVQAEARYAKEGRGTAPPLQFVQTIGGKAIYQYATIEDMPVGRLREGEIIFMELKATMDGSELRSIITAAKACLNPDKDGIIQIDKAQAILSNLLNRMDITYNFDLYKKLCGFWFIEEGEDPAQYNPQAARDKVRRWEAAGGMAFFFGLPLSEFLPSGKDFTENSEDYLRTMETKIGLLREQLKKLTTT